MPLGTLEYHLRQLELHDLVVTREAERFKAYFPSEGMDRRDRDYLYYLRQEMPRLLAMLIADQPGITFRQLAERSPISPSTLSFHLKKLSRAQIIQEALIGREKSYRLEDPERVRRLIVTYRATFVDEIVDRFAEAWLDLGV